MFNGHATTTTATVTYDEPYLVTPAGLAEGSTWTAHAVGTTTSSSAPDQTFDYEVDYEAASATSVTVPAGTFDVLEIDATGEQGAFTSYVHRAHGSVKSEGTELAAYTE